MVYFLPLSLQKRLLRYALSRLDLLETDALDLDRLGIEWGRKSTFELTNVALRKDVRHFWHELFLSLICLLFRN